MPPSPKINGKATFSEKLDVFFGLGGIVITTVYTVLRYPFTPASESQPTLGRTIRCSITRQLLDRFNAAQIQWAMLTSSKAYEDWISRRAPIEDTQAEMVTEVIGDDGTKIHWVGRKDAQKVLLHYHGGGFVMPLHKGHMSMINHFRREIQRRSGVAVKLAFPEYTLTPYATYPTQYRQATLALQHILDSGISPADILISGDSAGALLAFQILSHILHPHPSLPPIPIPTVPFAGILAMSPWVVFDSIAQSFVHNDNDTISSTPLRTWGRMIRHGSVLAHGAGEPGGYWSEPLKAPPGWWNNTFKVTKHVLFTYGEREAFRDDDVAFATKFKQGVDGRVEVTSIEEPMGLHVNPTSDAFHGRPPSDLTKIITGWVYNRIIE